MWTSTLDLSWQRVVPTRLLGRFWRGACLSSFAPLRVQNLPRQPLPATNWVRVRNRLSGISGRDLHLLYGDGDPFAAPAALPGHSYRYPGNEVIGEVIEAGEDVQYIAVGDRVALAYGPNCLTAGVQPLCRSCANGNYALCERADLPGPYPVGGGWSEEMLVHEQQLFAIAPAITDEQAVMLEPTAIALHAVLHYPPRAGDRVLIIGAGALGLLLLQVVRTLAPRAEVSVMARYPYQVEQATRLGATHIIYRQDSYGKVQRATEAHLYQGLLGNKMLLGGYDVIFDTIGTRKTIHDALRWTRAGGALVLSGMNMYMMQIDLTPIWHQEVKLLGSLEHGTEQWPLGSNSHSSTFSIAAELIEQGLLHPERMITHRFALNDYRQALTAAMYKEQSLTIKGVFDFALQPASVVPNVRANRQRNSITVDTGLFHRIPQANIPTMTSPPTFADNEPDEHDEVDEYDEPETSAQPTGTNESPQTFPQVEDSSNHTDN